MYKAKSGPTAEPCETLLYDESVTLICQSVYNCYPPPDEVGAGYYRHL